MKNLPSIYKNNNINPKNNNKIKSIVEEDNKENIINNIFNLPHPYDIKVIIKTKNKTLEDYLVSKNNKTIILLNNDKINIDDIDYIQVKKT